MNVGRRILAGLLLWTGAVTGAHMTLNLDWSAIVNDRLPPEKRKLNVAYIPVTCHRQDVVDRRPQAVQVLVDGIARSGLWSSGSAGVPGSENPNSRRDQVGISEAAS